MRNRSRAAHQRWHIFCHEGSLSVTPAAARACSLDQAAGVPASGRLTFVGGNDAQSRTKEPSGMSFSVVRAAVNFLCLLAFCLVWAVPGTAAVVTYTNRTAWVNALKSPGATTDTFAELSGNLTNPLIRPNFSVTGSAGSLRAATNINGSLPPQPYIVATNAGATITFTLNAPQTAFALQALQVATTGPLGNRTNVSGNMSVTLDGVPLTLPTNGPVFFGLTSTNPFTTVTLSRSTGSGAPAFDTVEFGRFTGEVLPVPEPGTAALVAASAAIAGLRRWRRRRVQPTHP